MISSKDVEHIARLARLRLTDEEKSTYQAQLNGILEYMNKLDELDTTDVEPTYHVLPKMNVFRADKPHESLSSQDALANCADKDDSFFIVPAVIEE